MKICETEESAIDYLIQREIVVPSRKCPKCKHVMHYKEGRGGYRCSKKSCRKEFSIFSKTLFFGNRIKIHKILILAYLYLYKSPDTLISQMLAIKSETVTHWCSWVRNQVSNHISLDAVTIGGPDVVVEIFEKKICRRKKLEDNNVSEFWVLAGIERSPEKKMFVIELPDRTKESMRTLISIYIKPGSIVLEDGLKSYAGATPDLDMEHQKVGHSDNFVDPLFSVGTDTEEGLRNGLGRLITPQNMNKKYRCGWPWYNIWRRQNKGDLWNAFIQSLKDL
ncbi:hypothetical protein RF11_09873 [Thelohanellus kitauei]|uniref:ISXO2-like transposase domain-containing protein n=1 Tax=Thelohanellus kitauei TaxID=669202 RepID=A0A0C2N6K0_THEKT|nr:hypothetical protein RF11_09873 [Thelohanellus kitauei]